MLINQSHHAFAVFDKQAGRCVRSRDTIENRQISNFVISVRVETIGRSSSARTVAWKPKSDGLA